jgi:capsule polysaccharide modification protein KpsS
MLDGLKITYVSSYSTYGGKDYAEGIVDAFQSRGHDITFFCTSKASKYIYQNYADLFLYKGDIQTDEEINRIIDNYNIKSLSEFMFCEQRYFGASYSRLKKDLVRYFLIVERYFNKNDIELVVQNLGGELIRRVFHKVCESRGVPCYYVSEKMFDRIFISHHETERVDFKYKVNSLDYYLPKDVELVREFIKERKGRQDIEIHSIKYKKRTIFDFIKNDFWPHIITGGWHYAFFLLTTQFERVFLSKIRFLFGLMFVKKIRKREKYIYFPLHAVDDSQITIRNPQYYNQVELVDYMQRSLPYGYKLVVKAHPGKEFTPRYLDIIRLARMKNVVLVNSELASDEFIKNSAATVIISSTVGIETLIFEKPLVVIGKFEFTGFGITEDVLDLSELSKGIHNAINKTVDSNKILEVFMMIRRHMYPGNTWQNYRDFDKTVASIEKRFELEKNN